MTVGYLSVRLSLPPGDARRREVDPWMCLGVPGLVLGIDENDVARVEVAGAEMNVSLVLVDGVRPGDYVLVHAGFAIQKIDEEEARKTSELLGELARLEAFREERQE